MASKYRGAGFPVHSFDIHIMTFKPCREDTMATGSNRHGNDAVIQETVAESSSSGVAFQSVEESQFEQVFKYLNSVVQIPRCEFQNVFLKVSNHTMVAVKGGDIVGFGAIQVMGHSMARLSPLYTENTDIAKTFLKYLLSQVPAESDVTLQVPDVQVKFVSMVIEECGFQAESSIVLKRLHSETKVELPFEKLFSLWNLDSVYPK